MSKLLLPIERGGQYDSFDMPISSLRQLVPALGEIFSFFLYTSHMIGSFTGALRAKFPRLLNSEAMFINFSGFFLLCVQIAFRVRSFSRYKKIKDYLLIKNWLLINMFFILFSVQPLSHNSVLKSRKYSLFLNRASVKTIIAPLKRKRRS